MYIDDASVEGMHIVQGVEKKRDVFAVIVVVSIEMIREISDAVER